MTDTTLLKPIHILFNEILNPLPAEDQEAILYWWREYNISYPNLFNGNLIAYHNHDDKDNSSLKFNWYRTNYAHYLQRVNDSSITQPARAIYCSVILVTDEDKVVVVQMSSFTSVPNLLQLPGGNIEIENNTLTTDICEKNASRELNEELGILLLPSQLELWRIKTGGSFGDIGLIYKNKNKLSEQFILDSFNSHVSILKSKNKKMEIEKILFIADVNNLSLCNAKKVDYLFDVIQEINNDKH